MSLLDGFLRGFAASFALYGGWRSFVLNGKRLLKGYSPVAGGRIVQGVEAGQWGHTRYVPKEKAGEEAFFKQGEKPQV